MNWIEKRSIKYRLKLDFQGGNQNQNIAFIFDIIFTFWIGRCCCKSISFFLSRSKLTSLYILHFTFSGQIFRQYFDKNGHSWGGSFSLISFWWRSLRLRESTNILHLYFFPRPMKLIQISVTERFRVSDYIKLKDLMTFLVYGNMFDAFCSKEVVQAKLDLRNFIFPFWNRSSEQKCLKYVVEFAN